MIIIKIIIIIIKIGKYGTWLRDYVKISTELLRQLNSQCVATNKMSFSGYEHTVTSHVNRLRIKIESELHSPEYILTSWGVGYRFSE